MNQNGSQLKNHKSSLMNIHAGIQLKNLTHVINEATMKYCNLNWEILETPHMLETH
jgi:hypothetical protein